MTAHISGFLALQRNFFDHAIWHEPRTYSRAEALLDILQSAAWKEHKLIVLGRLVEVPRGGFVISVRYLEARWRWSNTKVSQFMKMLQAEGMVTTEKRQGVTILLVTSFKQISTSPLNAPKMQEQQSDDTETALGRRQSDKGEEAKQEKEKKQEEGKFKLPRAGPSREEVIVFCTSEGLPESDGSALHDKWLGNGFTNAGQPIYDWQATIRTWRDSNYLPSQKTKKQRTGKPNELRPTETETPDVPGGW